MTLYLIDTSAAARMVTNAAVRSIIAGLVRDRVAATCITVDLEAGFSVRKPGDVAGQLEARARLMTTLPVTEGAAQRAREVQGLLALQGLHRAAGAMDLLTAAIAEQHGATVLHYDADFEHVASVTGQAQQWIALRGSID